MAVRYQTTVYNEKSRKITVSIKDANYTGSIGTFDTLSLGIQYDSESQQGQERFTPIIGSRCSLSLLINRYFELESTNNELYIEKYFRVIYKNHRSS
jgi:hypothetical protein